MPSFELNTELELKSEQMEDGIAYFEQLMGLVTFPDLRKIVVDIAMMVIPSTLGPFIIGLGHALFRWRPSHLRILDGPI